MAMLDSPAWGISRASRGRVAGFSDDTLLAAMLVTSGLMAAGIALLAWSFVIGPVPAWLAGGIMAGFAGSGLFTAAALSAIDSDRG